MLTNRQKLLARLAVAIAAVGASVTQSPAQQAPAQQTAVKHNRTAGDVNQAAQPISPEQFGKLQVIIKPHPGEALWSEIPWTTDAWEARQRAAKEGKPIFAWLPAGEPLGCT
jgi:hypothetical protein